MKFLLKDNNYKIALRTDNWIEEKTSEIQVYIRGQIFCEDRKISTKDIIEDVSSGNDIKSLLNKSSTAFTK